MIAAHADKPTGGESSAGPDITVTPSGVVKGVGFLPDHEVTVGIICPGEDVIDYLSYTTDRNGRLFAELPGTVMTGRPQIAATDHRPNPNGACGRLWSNTYTLDA
jgi:hypothetical protein